jgi:hypothetical protein
MVYVHSPMAQPAQMLLGASGAVRVWLNGEQVHEQATPRPAKPDEDRVPVRLQEGWNTVLVKVTSRDAGHALYLRFAGEGLRLSRNPVEDRLPGK